MERRKDIRAAIQGLLSPASRDSSAAQEERPLAISLPASDRASAACPCAEQLDGVFTEIQAELREHGVQTDPHEIARVLLQALNERPALCRGLFALHMLEER